MSKMNLKGIKQELLVWLKEKLGQIKSSDLESKLYLESCIKILESEVPKNSHYEEKIGYDPNTCKRLESLGINDIEAKILSALLANLEPISSGKLSVGLDIDRGKTYRALEKYYEIGVLDKIPLGVTRFVIKNKVTPFTPIINKLESEIKKFQDFKIE